MKRLILQVPDDYVVDKHVFAQYIRPMPGTVEAGGKIIIDALADDDFDHTGLGEDATVIGAWQWPGKNGLVELVPFDGAAMLPHLPPEIEYDEEGNVVSETPVTAPYIPHSWSGWPNVVIPS